MATQSLTTHFDNELEAITKDMDELKADYELLAHSLATTQLDDPEYFKFRQKIVRAARKLLLRREAELLKVQQEKEELEAGARIKREESSEL
ncbi:hypothetical protein OPT61_g8310 [Boeremia exigua]|uniref:Uncharacterized protein n=1 Tax=Boeremia exigua TaxID=749465 RepID=A0ACC2HZ49_9PLEO|nr:hypothetical protein OPT61_g8310 [Boeremia exigua]